MDSLTNLSKGQADRFACPIPEVLTYLRERLSWGFLSYFLTFVPATHLVHEPLSLLLFCFPFHLSIVIKAAIYDWCSKGACLHIRLYRIKSNVVRIG